MGAVSEKSPAGAAIPVVERALLGPGLEETGVESSYTGVQVHTEDALKSQNGNSGWKEERG